MKLSAALVVAVSGMVSLAAAEAEPPKAGKVQILKTSEIKPGMKATAWTVFEGTSRRPFPSKLSACGRTPGVRSRTSSSARWAARRSAPTSPAA